jgi:hypothetical protein
MRVTVPEMMAALVMAVKRSARVRVGRLSQP